MKEYSYTSTPPMGRAACTEPQCLYKGALYLYRYKKKTRTSDGKHEFKSETILFVSVNKNCVKGTLSRCIINTYLSLL